jgi:UDP-N-acetylmuramyl pentapeptide synthase
MRNWVIRQLQQRARRILDQKKPTIIAVTGSMGKTSAKQAIELVLATKHHVRGNKKNFNNELGVPLTILGVDSPGRSVGGWLKVLYGPLANDYPEMLVLEFGADHPGDIAALCELAPPKVGVVTGLSTVHAAYFKDVDELTLEKSKIISCLPADGFAILNADDPKVAAMSSATSARTMTYGSRSGDWSIQNLRLQTRRNESFDPGEMFALTLCDVVQNGIVVGELRLTNCLGYAPVMACLAGIVVGQEFGVLPSEAIAALNKNFRPVAGRLNPLPGIKGSLIIDDSYNAAPAAMLGALELLKMFTPGEEQDRRIAVLGQMAELGQYTQQEHRMIGLRAAEAVDLLVAVGPEMQIAVESAKEAGMEAAHIEWFATADEAGRFLDRIIQQGDVVLVKGSQSTRMEKVVKQIMAEPLRAEELLVRQDAKWLKE